jgi:antitoxin VapB
MDEVAEKCERLARLAADEHLHGILLTLQPNFAWLTGGRTNRIDGSRETGAGALLVTAAGRRLAVASRIESARLMDEALAGLEFELIEFAWPDERADPQLAHRLAAEAAGGRIGTDGSSPEAASLDGRITRLRAPLVAAELTRYRRLGRDLGQIVGDVARTVARRTTELEAAGALAAALAHAGIRAVVLLAAADGRIARYRHPTPTAARWQERLLLATCAERDGLVAAASRIITAGVPDGDLIRRTEASAQVCGALLGATRPGTTGAALFETAVAAYAASGFPGEERLHHQGGSIGYRARDWVAHPRSDEIVTPPQAFAWNPTVTGSKIEETVIVEADGRLDVITATPGWPVIPVTVRDQVIALPGVLAREV